MRFIPGRRSFLKGIPASLLAAMGLGRAKAATSTAEAIGAVAAPLKPVRALAAAPWSGEQVFRYLLCWRGADGVEHERSGDAEATPIAAGMTGVTIPRAATVDLPVGTTGTLVLARDGLHREGLFVIGSPSDCADDWTETCHEPSS